MKKRLTSSAPEGETIAQALKKWGSKRRRFYVQVVEETLANGLRIRGLEIIKQWDRDQRQVYLRSVGHVDPHDSGNFAFCDICALLNDLEKT